MPNQSGPLGCGQGPVAANPGWWPLPRLASAARGLECPAPGVPQRRYASPRTRQHLAWGTRRSEAWTRSSGAALGAPHWTRGFLWGAASWPHPRRWVPPRGLMAPARTRHLSRWDMPTGAPTCPKWDLTRCPPHIVHARRGAEGKAPSIPPGRLSTCPDTRGGTFSAAGRAPLIPPSRRGRRAGGPVAPHSPRQRADASARTALPAAANGVSGGRLGCGPNSRVTGHRAPVGDPPPRVAGPARGSTRAAPSFVAPAAAGERRAPAAQKSRRKSRPPTARGVSPPVT